VSRALVIAGSVALARILGKETFGEFGVIQSTVGMLGTLAGLGLGLTATKHVAELRVRDPQRAARILAFSSRFSMLASACAGILLALAAPWLSAKSLAAPHLAGALRASSLFLFFSGVSGAQLGALAGLHAFSRLAWVNVGYAATSVPLTLLGGLAFGLEGVVWGLSAAALAACGLGAVALRRARGQAGLPGGAAGALGEWPLLLRFSLPAALSGALVGPVNWACAAILVNQPNGYGEMGVFSAANQWFVGLMFLPTLMGQAALPLMAERNDGGEGRGIVRLTRRMVGVNAIVALPAVALGLASPLIMDLYGPAFRGRWLTLVLCLLTGALVAVLSPVGNLITVTGRLWTGLAMNLGWATAFLGATILLAPGFGADGVAGARLLAYLVHASWTLWFVSRQI
jgi:O-antigen/teichoic acid export membrane protein